MPRLQSGEQSQGEPHTYIYFKGIIPVYRRFTEIIEKIVNKLVSVKEKLQEHRWKSMNDEGVSMIDGAIGVSIGLIVLVAIYSIAPVIGSNIDASTTIDATSQWNSTTNPGLTTGVDLWQQNSSLLALAVMVSILSLVIFSIMAIRGRQED